jgi:hypothetical protein
LEDLIGEAEFVRHCSAARPRFALVLPLAIARVFPVYRLVVSSLFEITAIFVEGFGEPLQDETAKKRCGQPPNPTERQLNRGLYLRGLLAFGMESAREPCPGVAGFLKSV